MNTNPIKGDGFVNFSDMSKQHLYERSFEVLDSVVVALNARVAFETEAQSSVLAVYPWIVEHATQQVVWKPENGDMEREGLHAGISDSLFMPPGQYTAFFTTYGPTFSSSRQGSFLGLKPHWTNSPGDWSFSLRATDADKIKVSASSSMKNRSENESLTSGEVWGFRPESSRNSETYMFQVTSPSVLNMDVMASVCANQCDKVELFREPDTVPIWRLEEANSSPAGGGVVNRVHSSSLELLPGVYRMVFGVSNRQNHGNWSANPPWFPHNWGIKLGTPTPESVRTFNPWDAGTPIASLLEAGDNEDFSITMTVNASLPIVVYSMGELRSDDSKYDYGSIYKEGRSTPIWEMSYSNSRLAGGDELNREAMAILTLEPGTYYVKYVSDGTHSFDDWNKSRPNNSERWGVAVFPVDAQTFDASTVEVKPTRPDWMSESETETLDALGDVIVRHDKLAGDVTVDDLIKLESETSIVIVALGEISSSSSYDWGWIERLPTQEKVWEMTFQNTVQAGEDPINRRFYGTITLEPGEYAVHFETDLSHHFGDFGDKVPTNGSDWGITLYKKAQ